MIMLWLTGSALAVPEATFEAMAEAPEAPVEPEDTSVWLWQGFRHFWERRTFGGFYLPHRVSRFESRIREVAHAEAGSGGTYGFAQNTGVDGDWMAPEGYVRRVTSPDIRVHRGVEVVTGEDEVEGRNPRALQRYDRLIEVPKPSGNGHAVAVAVLQGLSFRSWCIEDDDSECRSDGIWPYRFRATLGACTEVEDTLACPLAVEVGRAWTPGRGGIRFIEEKPVETRMGIEVEINYAVITASEGDMVATPFVFENALASDRQTVHEAQTVDIPGLPKGLPSATVALTGLAFEFIPSRRGSAKNRGRYIGGWGVRVGAGDYNAENGYLVVDHAGGIWLPATVASTGLSLEVAMSVIQLAHEGAVGEGVTVGGSLCAPSNGAPWFSKWDRCDDLELPNQTEQGVAFDAP